MNLQTVALAELITFIVGTMKVVANAVIIGVKAKTSKMSSNAAFVFNVSPPLSLLFFIQIYAI
jgi:hypothetical protein